jgi:Flp pilus assembly protein TadG
MTDNLPQICLPSRTRRLRRGGALVEMALVLLPLMWISMGSIEFGYFFFIKHNVQAAARDGVRAGIANGAGNNDVTAAVARVMNAAGLGSSGYTVSITNPTNGNALNIATASAGTPVRVTVSCSWGTVGVRPMGFISNSKQVQGATVMRKE